tara:strand:+ start:1819 stop:2538 length:720 start_codon:yes stop_codon:yes gene_type:complete
MDIQDLPKYEKIIITARIKNYDNVLNYSYSDITSKIIDLIITKLKPKNIYVPSFNYDFLKSKYYDYTNSKSQIGRFSEEFRSNYSNNRNYDPVFSYTSLYSDKIKSEWCKVAFEKNSFFENIESNNYLVINIDLPYFTSTLIHYLEKKHKVPYRFDKLFTGEVMSNNVKFNLNYSYYVRDINKKSIYLSDKIESLLKDKNILKNSFIFNLKFDWYFSSDLINELSHKISKNSEYLIFND